MSNIKIAVAYLGAYNHFDYTYETHKESLFNMFNEFGIEYDIYAHLANVFYIHCTGGENGPKFEKQFIKTVALKNDNLKKHIPENWEVKIDATYKIYGNFFLDNIMKDQPDYPQKRFIELFKDKVKYIEVNNFEKLYKSSIGLSSKHEDFFETIIYLRHKIITEKIRNYEKKNNIKYDLIISIRPDLIFYNNIPKLQLKNIIDDCIKNEDIFYSERRNDFLTISKKEFSEILTKDVYYKNITKEELQKKITPIEKFISKYLKPKPILMKINEISYYANKFDWWWRSLAFLGINNHFILNS